MQFSKDNIDGALYYWTTSGTSAIMRWDFSGTTQSAQAYLTPANTDGHLVHRLPRAGPRRQQDGGQRERPGRRAPPALGHRQQQGAAALPAHPAQPVRVLEQRRDPVRRRVRRQTEHHQLRQGGAGQPDDLRRDDRHGRLDDRSRGPARRSPRLVEEHRRAEHDRVHLGRSHRRHQRSAPRHRRHRLRAVRRHRPGGRRRRWSRRCWGRTATTRRSRPTAIWSSTTSRPAPPVRRPRARRRTSRATPTPTRRRRCS